MAHVPTKLDVLIDLRPESAAVIAVLAGIHPSLLSAIRRQRQRPSIRDVAKLATFFDVDQKDVIGLATSEFIDRIESRRHV